MSYELETKVSYSDSPNIDAFGRLRVSQLTTQYDAKQLYDKLPLFVDEEIIGTATATHNTTLAKTVLDTPADGDKAILQTKQRFNYQSGKSQLMFWTFHQFGSSLSNIQIVINRTGTETARVLRADWDDPLDGTGVSGVSHSFNNNTIMAVDFEWLGVGAVSFYIVKNRELIRFHKVDFTDTKEVYMSSPNQPMRWEIDRISSLDIKKRIGYFSSSTTTPFNTNYDGIFLESTDTFTEFDVICSSVNTEGSQNQIGKIGGYDDNKTFLNATLTANWYFAQGIRLKTTHLDNLIDLLDIELFSLTNDDFAFRVCLNPTYTGSPTWTGINNYGVEIANGTNQTAITFGTILYAGYGNKESVTDFSIENAIRLGAKIDGTVDEIVVFVSGLSVGLDLHRAINWRELS